MDRPSSSVEQRLDELERTIAVAHERIRVLEARQRRTARWWSLALGVVITVAISWSVSAPARGAGAPGSTSATLYTPVTVEDRQTHQVIMTIDNSALVMRDHLNNKTVEIGTTTAGVGAVAVYNGSRKNQSLLVDLLSSTQNGGMLSIVNAGGREVANLQAGSGGDGSFELRRGNGNRLVTTGVTATGQGYVSTWTHGNTTGILIGEPSVIVGPKP